MSLKQNKINYNYNSEISLNSTVMCKMFLFCYNDTRIVLRLELLHIPDILSLHEKRYKWEIELETEIELEGCTCSISSLRMRWKLS